MHAPNLSNVRVVSYNCQSLCVYQVIFLNLLNDCDVLFIREILLGLDDQWKIGDLNSQFEFFGASAVRN